MKRVLVTGVNGFVGRHLANELAAQGYEVVGVGGPQGRAQPPEHVSDYRVVDLTDEQATTALDFTGIDYVVHLAGLAAVGPSFDAPMQYIATNIGIEVNLFEAALRQQVQPKFLVISSGSLYDPSVSLPLTEESSTLPNSPYAVSKLGQEQMAHYYGRRGFEVVIARPFNHIGPGQGPGFLLPDLLLQAVAVQRNEAKEIKVGNLDAKRDYTDVRDIARAYRLLLEKGASGEIYNICTGVSHAGNELLSLLTQAANIEPTVTTDPSKMRPSDTPDLYGSHEKLTRDTSWQPEISLEQTIRDTLATY